MRDRIRALLGQLESAYGPQGWWPLAARAGHPGFDARGYHPGGRASPVSAADRFEIIIGAILTQNTAWTNVETALARLRAARIRMPRDVLAHRGERISNLIRASGYFNQKARKLEIVAGFFARRGALAGSPAPDRKDLLDLWGIGPETADSILLYAFDVPVFVVDAYARRLFNRIGILSGSEGYEEIQDAVHRSLRRGVQGHKELHALIVAHAKRHCRTRPLCAGCPVHPCPRGDREKMHPGA